MHISLLAPQAELRVRPRFYEPEVHSMLAPLGPLFDAVGVAFVQGAAGDVAYTATDERGHFAATSCQHAIALGRYAGNNVAADLIGVAPMAYSQPKYVTCLDLGAWGAVYTEGWDRQLKLVRQEAKALKQQINSVWIYPPTADRAVALAAADPLIPVA
ncbi:hypothetical protein ASD70_02890 [Pseudomonas sp. Root569]|nr:hypothetical protein ASD70_02890 [Pseudomonas sp. Root569]